MLKFRVEGQKLTWENPDEVVVAGTKKYLECYFEFDGDAWSGFEYIEAFFKNGRDKPIRMLLSANRIWKEDGLCLTAGDWSVYLCATTYNAEKEEIERQITSSSVSIRVLAHGQFEDAQNSFESPEIANMYIAAMQVFEEAREEAENERVIAENARNVFEEYNPDKKYVKGNKVAYEGSSYVLTADEALGTNPTDTGSWLCIAEKGDKGEQGQQGIKGDKGASGGKIFSYALGYGKDVEVGSYKMAIPPFELIENGIDYNDIIVDTDGGCIFQYVASIGDDEAMLPAEGLHCIANPNGEKGDKGDKGERGIQGVQGVKGKDGFLGNEYKGEYSDDILYGDSDTVAFNSYTKANIGDYIIANPSVMTQFGNTISLWMCTECEDIYGNGNEYKLTFKRKFSYGNALPAVGENTQKRVLVTEGGGQPKWEDFTDGSASGAMVFKGEVNNYTELPTEATEGDIYFCSNYYSDFDINSIIFNDITQGVKGSLDYVKEGCIKGEAVGNFISYFESTINGFSMPQNIGEKNDYLFNDEYVCFIRRANSDLNGKYYYNALQVYKYSVSCIDDYEGGTDIIRSMYYTDVYNAEYLRNADVEYLNAKITQSAAWDWAVIPKSQINEYPKGAYIYSLGKWVHM